MKYLAIDYGQKRAGIAVSDAGGSMAFARTTLDAAPEDIFFRKLLALIAEENPDALVLGLPLNMDNQETKGSLRARAFAGRLNGRAGLPVFLVNEALTSFAAEEELKEAIKRFARFLAFYRERAGTNHLIEAEATAG